MKPVNQDFHAVYVPVEPLLGTKGIAAALADGISSSQVSQEASETSVKSFLEDYYATSESWSVKRSAQRVLQATNSWLYAQTRNGPYRYDLDRGYVCTFTALVLKAATAHIFHVGDARVYRLTGDGLEQLTEDHRLWVSREKSYLSRALGMRDRLEIDYLALNIEPGDVFILATDGVYEFSHQDFIIDTIRNSSGDLDQVAQCIVEHALEQGSDDNLTLQILQVEQLPDQSLTEMQRMTEGLPFPPELRPRMSFDGYQIIRELHHSHRSHAYLAHDENQQQPVVIKVPAIDLREQPEFLERFMMEEWVARRVNSTHLLKPATVTHRRNYLYLVTEYIEGQTLAQWIIDNPRPDLETVRTIVEQIARGLYALHRQEMLHQDLRPNNIMIDRNGTVKIIDFGSVRVAGLVETQCLTAQEAMLGTQQYAAPEYFIGHSGSMESDLYSLGVITYQMLSGHLPYGAQVARATTRAAQHKLVYRSLLETGREIPGWVDGAIRKAVHPNPHRRQQAISEFIYDLRHPNPAFAQRSQLPMIERNPLMFWKGVSLALFILLMLLLGTHPALTH
ncbi:MAG: bifunctional protein-serine/threonine kinase/phosphatase [Candidatus Thiodiazotropha sp.]